MEQTIKAIIKKANLEKCINGNYISHCILPLSLVIIKLDTGISLKISTELIRDYKGNSNISVCNRIKIIQ